MFMTWREERNRDEDPDSTYRIFADGTTVAYRLERNRFSAWAYDADPITCEGAESLGALCDQVPRSELFEALRKWSDPDNRKALLA